VIHVCQARVPRALSGGVKQAPRACLAVCAVFVYVVGSFTPMSRFTVAYRLKHMKAELEAQEKARRKAKAAAAAAALAANAPIQVPEEDVGPPG